MHIEYLALLVANLWLQIKLASTQIALPPQQLCVLPGTCSVAPTAAPVNIDLRIVLPTPPNLSADSVNPCPPGLVPCTGTVVPQCGVQYVQNISTADGIATPGAIPWQAYIERDNVFIGSGVLLDANNVLTAAHKVFANVASAQKITVKLGVWDPTIAFGVQVRSAASILIHPTYNNSTLRDDIAIIRLNASVTLGILRNINIACLPDQGASFIGRNCTVAGWGQSQINVMDSPSRPHKQVTIPIVSYQACRDSYRAILGDVKTDDYLDQFGNICAGGQAEKDACTNDGGGPLMCVNPSNSRFVVVGLVLWGIGCGVPGRYGVYNNVANYRTWIDRSLSGVVTPTAVVPPAPVNPMPPLTPAATTPIPISTTTNIGVVPRMVASQLPTISTCPPGLVPCAGSVVPQCGVSYNNISTTDGTSVPGSLPWQAYIETQNGFIGSGVLLDANTVLTAAHKVYSNFLTKTFLNVRVRLGVWDPNITFGNVFRFAVDIQIPTTYNNNTLKDDVAVIRLNAPVQLGVQPNINLACLPNPTDTFVGRTCLLGGWGQSQFNIMDSPVRPLKQIYIPIVSYTDCRNSFLNIPSIGTAIDLYLDPQGNLCAGGQAGKDACTNDGGGPLMCADPATGRYAVAGIVLWGKDCGVPGRYGVYANVGNYRQWIDSVRLSALPTAPPGGGFPFPVVPPIAPITPPPTPPGIVPRSNAG